MSSQIDIDITVPNQTRYLGMIGKIGESLAYTLGNYQGDREELAYHLNLVLTEAMANAICHANACDPTKEVKVSISASDKSLIIRVFDHGQGFDIQQLSKEKVKDTDEGGRGVQIIFKLMDQVQYLKKGSGHVLEMIKHLH
ncbi:serine/threonine-protein kinase RsbW [Malonomonas rubra DSM 5091]|uniref:Serine/threonine-protein kinase RsbW n=1 Tax=Malonomonas rubra DSM 5091 TaxID=1122189 RepID=A0A1M6CBF7_MALRU|nr:ATP-binding protein [Malonomonas rubra]SHI58151.1 serine/threonine-protein kinase RsbW [Malonomonas rubra DSM 5091]